MNRIILLVIIVLASFSSIAQDTIRVNDTFVKIIINLSEAIPDSFVKPDLEKYSEQSAVPLKPKKVISNEASSLLKEKSLSKYKSLIGNNVLYFVKVEIKGNDMNVKLYRNYLHSGFF